MAMQRSTTPAPKKPWRTPHCTKKTWHSPQFVAIRFGETASGFLSSKPESSTNGDAS
jgi:hypothetical protein